MHASNFRLLHITAVLLSLGSIGLVVGLGLIPSTSEPRLLKAGIIACLLTLLAGLWSLYEARRLRLAIAELTAAAERIAAGELSQGLTHVRRGQIGQLQYSFERMRVVLRETTYSRNYLHSVLNSMSDAVFVTSPQGTIRMANEAALLLTGYPEGELVGSAIDSLLAAVDSPSATALEAACESGETVLRTRPGQTIPVSFIASRIATSDAGFAGEIYVARDITERKRAERRIRYLARYDALTKIPNRMQFQHLLQQAIARSRRNGQGLALLYIDMDHFKEVNDTFGHASGDRVLEVLTERLQSVLSSETVLGRLAGDEFALFVDGVSSDAEEAGSQVSHVARAVLDTAGAAFHISQQEVFLTVSVGVAFCPRDAENVIDLIRNADAAMYYSKQNGGNSFAFYSQEMNAAAVERLMLKSKLRRAVERDEFVVRYMPKVDLKDGRIAGAEGLLRWRLPGHGDISPSQFIPLAEENNLISAVGEWVLERVCMDLNLLRRSVSNPGRIALNLSLKQLKQASFILNCRSVFERHNVPVESLELEITETTLMADPRRTVQMLDQLAAMGLHLSIDDFGTGYSSLSALQQFPIGTLKVDRSFISGVGESKSQESLVRTIIDMGHSLGMLVVAEGVESEAQLRFLRQNHCDQAQGRLFGEPVTIFELLEQMVRQQNGAPAFGGYVANAEALSRRA
jgi:diguanylate cyclase (GGDEF)-like protein/PAS domain S-box-containing protein